MRSAVGVLQTQPLQYATIPVDNDGSQGKQTAYALANPGSASIDIKIAPAGQDGAVVDDSIVLHLGPGQQVARYVWQDTSRSDFKGSLIFRGQNGATFVAVALVDRQGALTAIPLIPAKAPRIPN